MKKTNKLVFAVLAFTAAIFSGCVSASTNDGSDASAEKNQNISNKEKESDNMDYVTKYEIRNEIAVDCPEMVSKRRDYTIYGMTKHVKYYSNTCKTDRYFSIYFPGDYDEKNTEKKYPVIYFQHGIFGDENCIINDAGNKIPEIVTNLALDGNGLEAIIVFGNMYASDDPSLKPGFDDKSVLPYDNFINELVNDLMPYVESHYPVLTGRENTGVCGFSMGGRESLFIGLSRPDLFGYVGAISPAPGLVPATDWAMHHQGQFSSESEMKFAEDAVLPKLLMICCGTNDGTVGQFPKSYHKILQNNNVDHLWFEVLGADHNSQAIKTGFYQYMLRFGK